MWHSEPQDSEPDPYLVRNPGSGSVYNEYGSAALFRSIFIQFFNFILVQGSQNRIFNDKTDDVYL
jgi:hypothetical protein